MILLKYKNNFALGFLIAMELTELAFFLVVFCLAGHTILVVKYATASIVMPGVFATLDEFANY